MSTTKLQIIPDINGRPTYVIPQSNVIYTGLLSASEQQSITAPADAPAYAVIIGVANGADTYTVNATITAVNLG
jgi:hypothetical protein